MTDFSIDDIPEYGAPEMDYAPGAPVQTHAAASPFSAPADRPKWIPLLFGVPVLFAGISWLSNGTPLLTDFAMFSAMVVCIVFVLAEMRSFSRRFGVGGLVLFGGTLVWYMNDYMVHWFNLNYAGGLAEYSRGTVAKAAFFTLLFVMSASVGLLLKPPRWIVRLTYRIPEPPSSRTYFLAILLMFAVGLIPYVFFTRGNFFVNIYDGIIGGRSGVGVQFTAGRTGNYNYSWGGYLAQVVQIGETGGLLAFFYFIMIPGGRTSKVICLAIWLYWTLLSFGGGSRGEFLFNVLPAAGVIFLQYSTRAAAYLRRFSKRAILYTSIVMLTALFFVQVQGKYRNEGFASSELSVSNIGLFQNRGNDMFSEGLLGYQSFPTEFNFVSDYFPGAQFVMPYPDVAFRFGIGWIPRALWHDKPGATAVGSWYNQQMSGGTATNDEQGNSKGGGTVAPSISALAYMNYGWPGVIEMGLLFGYWCKIAERCLFVNLHKPFALMLSLGVATYLFRAFRDLTPHDLYPVLIGTLFGTIGILVIRAFAGSGAPVYSPAEAA